MASQITCNFRPDAVHGINAPSHAATGFLPRLRLTAAIWGWMALLLIAQATCTMAAWMILAHVPAAGALVEQLGRAVGATSADFMRAAATVVAGALFAAGAVLPLIYFSMRRWSRGFHDLHAAMRRLSRGARPRPLALRGTPEIDYLLVCFNDMAARVIGSRRELIEANETLEEHVAERTEQLQHAIRRAEAANLAKTRFVAMMSHEMRTSLNGVIGSLTVLRGTTLNPAQHKLVRTGELSAKALLHLVNDVLDHSAIEAGHMELADQPFTLREVLDEAVTIASPLADAKKIDLVCRVDDKAQGAYRGDATRLRQILINLLNNGIRFTDAGRVQITVNTSSDDADVLLFEVADTGIGIPQEAIGRLFHDFTQAGNDQTHGRGGSGLGLAICRELVQRMGGEISVQSQLNQGTTFRFAIHAPRIVSGDQPAPARSPSAHPAVETVRAPEAHLLVVDDHPVNLYIVKNLLDMLGVSADVVSGGKEAIQAVQVRGYDLILLDYLMPDMNGFTVARAIREMERTGVMNGRVPIIALTANVTDVRREACADAGIDGCLSKPVDLDQLRQAIVDHTRRRPDLIPVDPPLLDLEHLRRLCNDNPGRLETLLQMMDKHYRLFRQQLLAVTSQSPADTVKRLGHTIAGCAFQAEIQPLAVAARAMEVADPDRRSEAAANVVKLIDRCLQQLSNHTTRSTSPRPIAAAPVVS